MSIVRDEFLGERIDTDDDKQGFIQMSKQTKYYHAYCTVCLSERYLPGDARIEEVHQLHDTLCEEGCDGTVYHRVISEQDSKLPCERCQDQVADDTIGSTRFCADCAAEVRAYIHD